MVCMEIVMKVGIEFLSSMKIIDGVAMYREKQMVKVCCRKMCRDSKLY